MKWKPGREAAIREGTPEVSAGTWATPSSAKSNAAKTKLKLIKHQVQIALFTIVSVAFSSNNVKRGNLKQEGEIRGGGRDFKLKTWIDIFPASTSSTTQGEPFSNRSAMWYHFSNAICLIKRMLKFNASLNLQKVECCKKTQNNYYNKYLLKSMNLSWFSKHAEDSSSLCLNFTSSNKAFNAHLCTCIVFW